MKRFQISVLISFCFVSLNAQNNLAPVLKAYFRAHPFEIRFSSFITSLQEDPWFTTEVLDKRTDSSFFYMSGTYKNFNPFRFEAKEVRFTIAEDQFIHADSLQTQDTIINLQMMGITDSLPSNESLVKKEFTGFQKKYAKTFWRNNYSKNEKDKKLVWELANLFLYPYSVSPVSVAWGRIPETGDYIFTITIRCKVKHNIADFILPPEGL